MTICSLLFNEKRMAEAEVALRVAIYLVDRPGATPEVTVSLDEHHEKSNGKDIFLILEFLTSEGWSFSNPCGKKSWHGTYTKQGKQIVISPNSRGGDVVAQIGSKRIRVECKKGPLVKAKGNPENRLIHEAIGQLMTIEDCDENDILLVAVPATERSRRKTAWQARPLMRRAGISLVFVGRDGTVEGMPDLTEKSCEAG